MASRVGGIPCGTRQPDMLLRMRTCGNRGGSSHAPQGGYAIVLGSRQLATDDQTLPRPQNRHGGSHRAGSGDTDYPPGWLTLSILGLVLAVDYGLQIARNAPARPTGRGIVWNTRGG